jgi:hypothetical protein
MMNVVPLRDGPLVTDIVGQLRRMADDFERGDIAAESVLLIIPRQNDWPSIFGWGAHLGDHGNIAVCEMAKTWFVNNLVAR